MLLLDKCLALHLRIDTPLEEARRITHDLHHEETELREEEAGKLLLGSDLAEDMRVNLAERLASGNGLHSIRSRLEGIVQSLTSHAVSKSARIADQDDTVV